MKPRRVVIGIAIVVLVQVAAIALYTVVDRRRAAGSSIADTRPPRPVQGTLTDLTVRHRDGAAVDLAGLERPTIVHLWATWCAPCKEELPLLLEFAARDELPVLAVSLDPRWEDVDAFLDETSPYVVLGDATKVAEQFAAGHLPTTFLVAPGGVLELRADGARDWSDEDFVTSWRVSRP